MQVINSSKTKDSFLGACLRELWLEVSKKGFQLRAIHLPGEENRVPDWLSRWELGSIYKQQFYDFMGDEVDEYTQIHIPSEMFEFSEDL